VPSLPSSASCTPKRLSCTSCVVFPCRGRAQPELGACRRFEGKECAQEVFDFGVEAGEPGVVTCSFPEVPALLDDGGTCT
jgi:hypothetical protein